MYNHSNRLAVYAAYAAVDIYFFECLNSFPNSLTNRATDPAKTDGLNKNLRETFYYF